MMRLTVFCLIASLEFSLGQGIFTFGKNATCQTIENAISSASSVYYPSNLPPVTFIIQRGLTLYLVLDPISYYKGISHWASSSTQIAKCVVEPGTAADVARTVHILILV
jgi:hypothetical protein